MPSQRMVATGLALSLLLALAATTLWPFVPSLVWAALLAYVLWPAFCTLRASCRSQGFAALVMTILVGALIIVPVIGMSMSLQREVAAGIELVNQDRPALIEATRTLPVVGPRLAEWLQRVLTDPQSLERTFAGWLRDQAGILTGVARGLWRSVFKIGLTLFALFFFFRDGPRLLAEVRLALERLFGPQGLRYFDIGRTALRSVVFGVVLTSLVQGAAAGVGYWMAGAPAPFLLATLTALAALLPFGSIAIWAPVSIGIALVGDWQVGAGLAIWGVLVVSSVDNLLRPFLISSAAHLNFLLVTLGVLGGGLAFGLLGIFVGPVTLALLIALWRDWIELPARTQATLLSRSPISALDRTRPGVERNSRGQ